MNPFPGCLENPMSHLTYYRPDGVVGVGFEITHSAKLMHSIAWPDRCAERMLDDELVRKQIWVVGPAEQTDAPLVSPSEAAEESEASEDPAAPDISEEPTESEVEQAS